MRTIWYKPNRTMAKRKHHTEEEIIRILKEAEAGMPVADLLRKYNINQPILPDNR